MMVRVMQIILGCQDPNALIIILKQLIEDDFCMMIFVDVCDNGSVLFQANINDGDVNVILMKLKMSDFFEFNYEANISDSNLCITYKSFLRDKGV